MGEPEGDELLNEAIDTIRGIILERNDEKHFVESTEYIANHSNQSIAISALIETCRTISDYNRKTILLKALGKLKAEEAVNILLTTVKLGSKEHKEIALEALVEINSRDSITPIIFLYFIQPENMRAKFLKIFKKMDRNILEQCLIQILKTDKDISFRRDALDLMKYLGFLGDVEYDLLKKRYASDFSEIFIPQKIPEELFGEFDKKNLSLNIDDIKTIIFETGREIIYERELVSFTSEEKKSGYKVTYLNMIDQLLQSFIQGKQINFKALKQISSTLDELVEDDIIALFKLASNNSLANYLIIHLVNTGIYAAAWGKKRGFSEHQRITLIISALLHDLGMTIVPKLIWNKSKILQEDEKLPIYLHPLLGVNCLKKSHYISHDIIMACLQHHENIDGGGYPKKQSGSDITEYAKMIRIIDSFEALTKSRKYRGNSSIFEALRIMRNERGKFDNHLLTEFVNFLYSSNLCNEKGAFKNILFSVGNSDIVNISDQELEIMDATTNQKNLKMLIHHIIPDAVAVDLETIENNRIGFVNFLSEIMPPEKILVLTNSTYKEEILNFHKIGIKNILRKPCEINNIISRSKDIMQH